MLQYHIRLVLSAILMWSAGVLGAYADPLPTCLAGYCLGDQVEYQDSRFEITEQDDSACPTWIQLKVVSNDVGRSNYLTVEPNSMVIYRITDINLVDSASSLASPEDWSEFLIRKYGITSVQGAGRNDAFWTWFGSDSNLVFKMKVYFSDRHISFSVNKFPGQHQIRRTISDQGPDTTVASNEGECLENILLPD